MLYSQLRQKKGITFHRRPRVRLRFRLKRNDAKMKPKFCRFPDPDPGGKKPPNPQHPYGSGSATPVYKQRKENFLK
jgi:hypothetical protein